MAREANLTDRNLLFSGEAAVVGVVLLSNDVPCKRCLLLTLFNAVSLLRAP